MDLVDELRTFVADEHADAATLRRILEDAHGLDGPARISLDNALGELDFILRATPPAQHRTRAVKLAHGLVAELTT